MDIKSVIKTLAEAWAAASLKIEEKQNQAANIPGLSSNYSPYWRTFPSLPGEASDSLTLAETDSLYSLLPDLTSPDTMMPMAETENPPKGSSDLRWRSDIKMVNRQ